MKYMYLFYILIVSCSVFSASPTNPYFFSVPDFNNMLPFPAEELRMMQTKHVKRFSIKTDVLLTMYYLNDAGQIYFRTTKERKKKKYILLDSTYYKYNSKGQVTSIRSYGDYTGVDTLAYNSEGRVIFYQSAQLASYGNSRKKFMSNTWKLQMVYLNEKETCLEDRSDTSSMRKVYINAKNEFIKMEDNSVLTL